MKFRLLALLLVLLGGALPAQAGTLSEYQLKAAFLFNFVAFTEWPAAVGDTLRLCVYGEDPFGENLDKLAGKKAGNRSLTVKRAASVLELDECQIVFISRPAIGNLPRVLDRVHGKPVLTVADSPDAARQGVALNMGTAQDKVNFEANLIAARGGGLNLSSKLLRLATQVYQ